MDLISELRRGGLWRSFVIWTDNISTPWSPEHTVSSGVNSADTKWKLITHEQPAVQSLLNKLHKPQSRTWQKAALSENLANFFFKAICHDYSDLRAKWNRRHCWAIKQVLWKYFHTLPSCHKLFFFFSTKDVVWMFGFFFFFFFFKFLSSMPWENLVILLILKNGVGCK